MSVYPFFYTDDQKEISVKTPLDKRYTTYASMRTEDVIALLKTSATQGLSESEASKRYALFGANTLPNETPHLWNFILNQIKSPFLYLFAVACIVYTGIGEYANAAIILIIITINFLLTVYEEYRAYHNIQLLKRYLISHATVVRSGVAVRVDSNTLVPGDIITLQLGDKIPADCRFISTEHVTVDESSLTGESVPIDKIATPSQTVIQTIFDAHTIGFAGTIVSSGRATAIVYATGIHTEFGHIALSTQQKTRQSDLATSTQSLASFILKLVIAVVVITFLIRTLIQGYPISITELFIFSAALAISVIPEALPLVTTLSLSQGAVKLAHLGIIVKRLSALEDLGTMQILCTDKTGTLTENSMTVVSMYPEHSRSALTTFGKTLSATFHTKKNEKGFESAVWQELTPAERDEASHITLLKEMPFDATTKKVVSLIKNDTEYTLITRGAPEVIFELCTISADQQTLLREWIQQEERKGNRVLAIAQKKVDGPLDNLNNQQEYTLTGLITFTDPIKKTAHTALERAHNLGVRIKILSGDSPSVCETVAQTLGILDTNDHAITGAAFSALPSNEQKLHSADTCSVFARFSPEQKYELITILSQQYAVGYLGDGINDAPSLKTAHVGLSVDNAADISRDAADIILLKKNLSVIVDGIQAGRVVFINTLKYITITIVANFGNFFAIVLALFFLDYIPLLPTQLLIINLIPDIPTTCIATDTVPNQDLKEIPHYSTRAITRTALILGLLSNSFDIFFFLLFKNKPMALFRTCWFVFSILSEIVLIFALRTKQPFLHGNWASLPLIISSLIAAGITLWLPFSTLGQRTLQFVAIPWHYLIFIIGMTSLFFVANQLMKTYAFARK